MAAPLLEELQQGAEAAARAREERHRVGRDWMHQSGIVVH